MAERADLLDLHLAALFTQDEQGNLVATNDPEPDQVAAPRLYLGRSRTRAVLRFRRGMGESTRAALRKLAGPDMTSNDPNREPANRAEMVKLLAEEQPIENIYFGPAFSFPDSFTIGSTWSRHSDVRLPLPLRERAGACPVPRIEYGAGIDTGVRGRPFRHSGVRLPLPLRERAGVRGRPLRHSGGGRNPASKRAHVIEISPSNTHLLSPEFAWLADELAVRSPVMAIVVGDMAVSVCFSARSTRHASEAGVETLPEHRGRRHAGTVTAAWADAVRRQGRIPLYSTSWTNHASRRVAARLGLIQYATDFHIT